MSRLSCHGCAYEWADPCERLKVHFPSDHKVCESCQRNPNPTRDPTIDHYVTAEQAIEEAVRESHE